MKCTNESHIFMLQQHMSCVLYVLRWNLIFGQILTAKIEQKEKRIRKSIVNQAIISFVSSDYDPIQEIIILSVWWKYRHWRIEKIWVGEDKMPKVHREWNTLGTNSTIINSTKQIFCIKYFKGRVGKKIWMGVKLFYIACRRRARKKW